MTISASQWGSPLASRKVLLIHGVTMSSSSWEGLAQLLVAEGFFVVAPNLRGHGGREGSDFRVSAMAEDLLPYFAMGISYDVIIGHSLGGTIAVSLLPFLPKTKETTVILIDPALEFSPDAIETNGDVILKEIEHPRSADEWMTLNPRWSRRDCVLMTHGISMCTSTAIQSHFQHNRVWSFSGLLNDIPPNLRVTALVADPTLCTYCRVEHFPGDIDVKVVTGSGHWIQFEQPEAIISAIPQPRF